MAESAATTTTTTTEVPPPTGQEEKKEDPVLGIDFGSQKIVVAALKSSDAFPFIVGNNLNNHSTP
jgi:molecular chaperone DnaK (HSP70)